MIRLNDTPILGTGQEITLTGSVKTLEDMGVVFSPLAEIIRVRFYEPLTGALIGKYTHDTAATISATDGIPIIPGDPVVLNRSEFQSKFITSGSDVIAMTEQFGIIEGCDFISAYTKVIAQLLPDGAAWIAKFFRESNFFKVLSLFGKGFSDFNCFLDLFTCEFFASRAKVLRDNWQNELFDSDISDCFAVHDFDNFENVQAMIMKVISRGARRKEDYIEIAEIIGLEVEVTDAAPNLTFNFINTNLEFMDVCSLVCSKLRDGPDSNLILAYICILKIIAPAHLNLVFKAEGCELEIE